MSARAYRRPAEVALLTVLEQAIESEGRSPNTEELLTRVRGSGMAEGLRKDCEHLVHSGWLTLEAIGEEAE